MDAGLAALSGSADLAIGAAQKPPSLAGSTA